MDQTVYFLFALLAICSSVQGNLFNVTINTGAVFAWQALGKTYNGSISLLIRDKDQRETQLELYENVPIQILSSFTRTVDLDINSRDIRNVSFIWKCSDEDQKDPVINSWLVTFDPIYRDVPTRGAYFKFFCNYSWTKIPSEKLTQFYPCWIDDIHKRIDYEYEHNPE